MFGQENEQEFYMIVLETLLEPPIQLHIVFPVPYYKITVIIIIVNFDMFKF